MQVTLYLLYEYIFHTIWYVNQLLTLYLLYEYIFHTIWYVNQLSVPGPKDTPAGLVFKKVNSIFIFRTIRHFRGLHFLYTSQHPFSFK